MGMSTYVGRNLRHCNCVLLLIVVAATLNLEHTHPEVNLAFPHSINHPL
jgi:hypothetical protein